jgi:hypothetical protein
VRNDRRGTAPVWTEEELKMRAWVDAGRRFTLVISRSPGNSFARQNSRAALKRLLRNANQNGSSR